MDIPIIFSCDAVIAGGGINAMILAVRLSVRKKVTLIVQETCLYAEMNACGDWRLPIGLKEDEQTLFFPDALRDENGLFHPDRLKCHGEKVLAERGVSLLYGCQALGIKDGAVILAHLSGLYAVPCKEAWEERKAPSLSDPAYCLHTMRDGKQQVLIHSSLHSGTDARRQYLRYCEALSRLPKESTLARGGVRCTDLNGLQVSSNISVPLNDLLPGQHEPLCKNPVQDQSSRFLLVHGFSAAQEKPYDLIVVGGGTSGAPAALFAARGGLRVLLLEMNDRLGGTATAGGVSTYWFGLRDGATAQIDREVSALCQDLNLPRKACLWNENDNFFPDIKAHVLLKMCLDSGVDVRFGCIACGVKRRMNSIQGIYWAQNGKLNFAEASMTLDCTGDGSVCMFAGADHIYGSENDGMTYWASLAQYNAPDTYRNNFSTMVHLGDPQDYTRFIISARQQGGELYDHGQYLAVRESRHIRGMEQVTLEDLLSLRPQNQPLYDCFSNLDPKGRITTDFAFFGLLCPNRRVSVPRGALIPVDDQGEPLLGLLVGGKAISCRHDAFPLLRMQPDLQRQGLALAALALCAVHQHCPAWQAENIDETILSLGGDLPRKAVIPALPPLSQAIFSLDGQEAWEWLDASPISWDDTVSPIVQIMLAKASEAVPLLRQALNHAADTALRVTLSRLLLWHGDDLGAPAVIQEIQRMLDETPYLPRRTASVNYGQLLPDHGLMPECVYLLNSLARTAKTPAAPLFEKVLSRIENSPRDWSDIRAGMYCYIESIAYVAREKKEPAFIPLLKRALALPEFSNSPEEKRMEERLDILRVTLLAALVTLGDSSGKSGLTAFLQDERLPFREAAKMLLQH